MSLLIAGGDSFTWGSELPDCNGRGFSRSSWSALLAEQRSLSYHCVAKPGSSNQSIARRVMEAVEQTDDIEHVAVMWTYVSRYELRLMNHLEKKLKEIEQQTDALSEIDSGWLNITKWQSMSLEDKLESFPAMKQNPWFVKKMKALTDFDERYGISDLSRLYYSLTSMDQHRRMTNNSIYLLQSYLDKRGIDHSFYSATNEVMESIQSDSVMSRLIDRSRFRNPDQGFVEWSSSREIGRASCRERV